MKNFRMLVSSLFVVVAMFGFTMSVSAQSESFQDQKQIYKERQKLSKMAKEQATSNIKKEAKKAVKIMEKDGWKPAPGSPTLFTQQNDMLVRRYELNGYLPKYFLGRGTAVSQTAGMARKQAIARARFELAGSIGSEVASLTESSETNTEFSNAEQETVGKVMESGKILIQQTLGRTDVIMEAQREKDGKVEVMVYVCCASKGLTKEILKMFEKEHKELRDKMEKLLESDEK